MVSLDISKCAKKKKVVKRGCSYERKNRKLFDIAKIWIKWPITTSNMYFKFGLYQCQGDIGYCYIHSRFCCTLLFFFQKSNYLKNIFPWSLLLSLSYSFFSASIHSLFFFFFYSNNIIFSFIRPLHSFHSIHPFNLLLLVFFLLLITRFFVETTNLII